MRALVNPVVLDMLETLKIDYLGVSLDALLIIAPQEYAGEIMRVIKEAGVAIDIIGRVEKGSGAEVIINGEIRDFTPRFRESAYTPIKKMIGEEEPRDFFEMKHAIDLAAANAIEKKRRIVETIKKGSA